VRAVQMINALTAAVFPLCRDHCRQTNWLESTRNRRWYSVGVKPSVFSQNSTGSWASNVSSRLSISQLARSRARLRPLMFRLAKIVHLFL